MSEYGDVTLEIPEFDDLANYLLFLCILFYKMYYIRCQSNLGSTELEVTLDEVRFTGCCAYREKTLKESIVTSNDFFILFTINLLQK